MFLYRVEDAPMRGILMTRAPVAASNTWRPSPRPTKTGLGLLWVRVTGLGLLYTRPTTLRLDEYNWASSTMMMDLQGLSKSERVIEPLHCSQMKSLCPAPRRPPLSLSCRAGWTVAVPGRCRFVYASWRAPFFLSWERP